MVPLNGEGVLSAAGPASPATRRRVLIVSHYYDPEPLPKAGELARALHERGYDVRVVTGLPAYPHGQLSDGYHLGLRQREQRDGIEVTRTFEVPYHGRSAVGRVLNYGSTAASLPLGLTRGWAPDAVYVWAPPPTTVFPAHLLARAGRPWIGRTGWNRPRRPRLVMDIQDLWPDFGLFAGLLHEGRAVDAMRWIERVSYGAADRLVVPTEGYRQAVLAKGVLESKVEVIPNWIPDEDADVPAPEEVASARPREGWDGRFVVLFAGNLGSAQGLDAVLDAAEATDEPDVLFAFAGDGTERQRLMRRAEDRGLGDRVQFLGRRDPATMPALAGAADVLLVHLHPSPIADVVVPTKINGYLAYGRPILCALRGEGASLVRQAEAGVVVEPGDVTAIRTGVSTLRAMSPEARVAMGERGRAFARRELIRSTLLSRYEKTLGLTPSVAGDAPDAPAAAMPASGVRARANGREPARGPLLVTGATGAVGTAVVAAARAAGVSLRVLVRRPVAFPDDVEVVLGDLRDVDAVRAAVRGCDAVVHLAAAPHARGIAADLANREITEAGAITVFAAAEAAGVRRVVFASSIAVYGGGGSFDELSVPRPLGTYGAAKVAAEDDLRRRTNARNEPLGISLRLATCYGPGLTGNVNALFEALARRRFVLVGAGANRKSLLHVTDAADAILLAVATPQVGDGTYDVSDGCPRPLREVVDLMCTTLGRPPALAVPEAPVRLAIRFINAAARRTAVDLALVETLVVDVAVAGRRIRDLGFVPAVDLPAGLAGLFDARTGASVDLRTRARPAADRRVPDADPNADHDPDDGAISAFAELGR